LQRTTESPTIAGGRTLRHEEVATTMPTRKAAKWGADGHVHSSTARDIALDALPESHYLRLPTNLGELGQICGGLRAIRRGIRWRPRLEHGAVAWSP